MQPDSDIRQGDAGQLHQAFGFFNPFPLDIVAYGEPGFFFEQLRKITGIQSGDLS
ncbi:hypothetical protein D3C74_497820 [compost metagenome]